MLRFLFFFVIWIGLAGLLYLGLQMAGLQEVVFFLQQQRVTVSLNFFFVTLLLAFAFLYLVLRVSFGFLGLPKQAGLWRARQREREALRLFQLAIMYFYAGRFVKARKALKPLLAQANTRATALFLSAEAGHAVQFQAKRDTHVEDLEQLCSNNTDTEQIHLEALLLSQTRWALEAKDTTAALSYLDTLPQGAARRIEALRLRLRVEQAAGKPLQALETASKLTRHGVFSPAIAQVLLQRLRLEAIQASKSPEQLEKTWVYFNQKTQEQVSVLCAYAEKHLALSESSNPEQAKAEMRTLLLPVLKRYPNLEVQEQAQFAHTLTLALPGLDASFLQLLEDLQLRFPADPLLRYLSGASAHALGLWGKAKQALQGHTGLASHPVLQDHAQRLLAHVPSV